MTYTIKRQLKRLSDEQLAEDIKKYIKTSYSFYETKAPEFKVLAKRLHEEYSLREFYRIFNKLWKSGYRDKMSLAVYTLQLYSNEFNLETYRFLKPRLREIKSWDKVDSIGMNIIGQIALKYPALEDEIIKMNQTNSRWLKRMAMTASIPQIRNGDFDLAMKLITINFPEKEEHVQKGIGILIDEIGKVKEDFAKRFIIKRIHEMNPICFHYATENLRDLRSLKKIKKLTRSLNGAENFENLMFWKN